MLQKNILCSLVYLGSLALALAFTLPPNDGYVTDAMQLLSSDDEERLEQTLKQYKEETSNEIAVLIVESLEGQPIAELAFDIGNEWGVGTDENDNGILMLISYSDREMFIATGYGLEGAVPDIVAAGIIEEDIAPHFREGQYYEGISAGIDALQKHIGGEYTVDRYDSVDGSIFGGWLFFLAFIFLEFLAAFLGRSKSWWLGGVIGGALGVVLVFLFSWWLAIPILAALGLLFDFLVSKHYKKNRRRRGDFWIGGGGGGSGGGGFGGFSGGSFGGGGGGGSW